MSRGPWTPEHRARYEAAIAARPKKSPKPKVPRVRAPRARPPRTNARHSPEFRTKAVIEVENAMLRAAVADLTRRVEALEARPVVSGVRVVEWRPDHRRQADGGEPVRRQRQRAGLPKRLSAVPA